MAETNICSHIYGLNGSNSTNDVYSDDSDWVDYKTYSGGKRTHKTTYDSFYEIQIPLATLGIDANYIKNNGIGAMLVATRGESGLDCIPFDDTMLDNVKGSYSADASTSKEKEDEDVITSPLARIGNTSVVDPIPGDDPTPVGDPLTITANSNYFPSKTFTNSNGEQYITVDYKLKSTAPLMNSMWELSYDTSKLKFVSASMPNVDGFAYDEPSAGLVKGNFTTLNFANFSTEKDFVKATFKVLSSGTTTTNFDVKVLGVRSNGTNKYPVDNGTAQTVSGVTVTRNTVIAGNNVMLGDVDGNGVITVADATLVQQHAIELEGDALLAADTSKDGIITVADATLIQKFAAEMIDEF